MNDDMDLRSGQESGDHLQNIRIAPCSVIESRGIDESYSASIKGELVRELYFSCTRVQAHPNPQIRAACKIDELEMAG